MTTRASTSASPLVRIELSLAESGETLAFAASELAKYLRLMSTAPAAVTTHVGDGRGIVLRRFDTAERRALGAEVDERLDDAVRIEVRGGAGTIAGLNERSVLLAVYRFLHELGCRWVRPGADGEWIPRRDLATANVLIAERPAYRHRAICIEGACSLEHVLDLVDWAPKAGYSDYFMQFTDGYAFFERWYARKGLPAEGEAFSSESARAWTIRVEHELARRGLVYHAVGHGWTCMALGARLSHWDPSAIPDMPAVKHLIAEVGGQRALQWDRPMITSLCFSNAEARSRMIAAVADHAGAHPEVDLLHVWIDDGGGNKCECASCRGQLPADLYVRLLTELHQELDRRGLRTRIVFLGYSDLLWPPSAGAPALDRKRFVFMYANSRESYAEALRPVPEAQSPLPPFALNKNRLARDHAEFQAFLRGWQRYFGGDSFIYEYHPLGQILTNQHALSYVVNEDARQLRTLGLNGLVACQAQRVFFPTGVASWVLGRSLWRPEQDPTDLMDDYFRAACGQDGTLAKEFLKVSSEQLDQAIKREGKLTATADAAACFARLDGLCAAFAKVVERNLGEPDPCRNRTWTYLRWYLRLLERLTLLYRQVAGLAPGDARTEWASFKEWLAIHELELGRAFDAHSFAAQLDGYIINGRYSTAPEAVIQR